MSNSRSPFVAACALVAAMCPMVATAANWYEVRTPDFHFISVVGAKQTRRIVDDTALYQSVMATALKNMEVRPKLPVTMFLLDEVSWNRYVPLGKSTAGVVYSRPSVVYVVVNADSWMSASPIVFHELTHVLLLQNARGTRLPPWYNEGYADFFSTISKKGETVQLGVAPWWRWVSLKERPWMPLQQVLSVTMASPEYQEEKLAQSFYASSWLMIHYGLLQNPKRGQQLERYRLLLSQGLDHQRAWQQAFPDDKGEFESELQAYAKQTRYHYFPMPLPEITRLEESAVVRFPEADAMDALAGWALYADITDDEKLKLARDLAAKAAPDSVAAVQLAAFHAKRGERDQALALAEKGCASTSSNRRVAMVCGNVYFEILSEHGSATDAQQDSYVDNARRHYGAVLAADPDSIEALLAMAHTTQFEPLPDTQVRSGLERLWQMSIRSSEIGYTIARLYLDDDLARSRDYLEQSLLIANEPRAERDIISLLRYVESAMAN